MDKIIMKLTDLENERECIEKCQKELREQMTILEGNDYLEKKQIYYKNKCELEEVNRKITTLNNAMDILENIG